MFYELVIVSLSVAHAANNNKTKSKNVWAVAAATAVDLPVNKSTIELLCSPLCSAAADSLPV